MWFVANLDVVLAVRRCQISAPGSPGGCVGCSAGGGSGCGRQRFINMPGRLWGPSKSSWCFGSCQSAVLHRSMVVDGRLTVTDSQTS
jgi:hypothetical protein